ncbi:Retrotransposon protein, Ty3-gypsy sub-class [Phytophthora megakarya]|uniref:Retrotransposon protein, Ty3-gypsy sub-class n=1 Tax=Phytophthora megakarya TaxID=4795 RepID=A0A225WPU8_9STRA|nr:Retrotransposon protein, Ty3-gypsy sub-class [Phytophthora megakarya]
MDFMTKLPDTDNGFDAILRAHFQPTTSNARTVDTATLFRNFYRRLHGILRSIVSDRDAKVTAKLWQNLMELKDITPYLSTAFKPSKDGRSEATNKVSSEYLLNFNLPTTHEFMSQLECRVFMADLDYEPHSVADYTFPALHEQTHPATFFP